MRRVILYIAASLDGYIAGENGGVDWLDREAAPDDAGNGYEAFLREIDTIVMGYNTYRQVTEELSPGKWVYAGKKTYVDVYKRQIKLSVARETDKLSLLIKQSECRASCKKRLTNQRVVGYSINNTTG